MTFSPRHILVTGGAGFIGANFIHYMLNQYCDINITNIDKLTYAACLNPLSFWENSNRYFFSEGDICDKELIEKILIEKYIDTIVHFAAESHVDRSIANPENFIQTNLVGTFTLLEAARHVFLKKKRYTASDCRFHHISTDEVFGSLALNEKKFTEKTAYAPNSPYSASKAGSDHLVRAYQHTYHLPTTLSHCTNNYGPYQHVEKFIPMVINACLKNKSIPIYNDGSNRRDWLYVLDHCHAIDLIIRHGQVSAAYNIGGDEEQSNIELAKLICHLMAKQLDCCENQLLNLICFVSDRPGHDFRYAMDTKKIETQLGWKKKYNLISGLINTIGWYLKSTSILQSA